MGWFSSFDNSGSSKQNQVCSDEDPDIPLSIKVHLLLQAYKDEILIVHPNRGECDRHVGHRWTMWKLMGQTDSRKNLPVWDSWTQLALQGCLWKQSSGYSLQPPLSLPCCQWCQSPLHVKYTKMRFLHIKWTKLEILIADKTPKQTKQQIKGRNLMEHLKCRILLFTLNQNFQPWKNPTETEKFL